jgi:hypothetical protein
MSDKQDILNKQEQAQVRNDWKAWINKVSYKAIVNNIPFIAYLALLCMVYITNSNRMMETHRELNAKNKVLKELRWRYMDVKSQLMYAGMETQVIRSADKIGLKPLMLPAYTIVKDTTAKQPR